MLANKTENLPNDTTIGKRLALRNLFLIAVLFIAIPIIVGHRLSSATAKKHTEVDSIAAPAESLAGKTSVLSRPAVAEPPPAGSTQSISFDDVGPFVDVSARYSYIRFSSPGLQVYSWQAPFPHSSPNAITRGILGWQSADNRHFADMIIDFTQPVNNVKFFITGGDNFGTVAYLDYYQNGNPTQTNLAIGGPGPSHTPIPIELNFNNITKVKVHHITDNLGLTFDDFSFTVPAPTPTPTPTPTPPSTPNNLKAVPDENSATLTWSPSAGAVSYVVTPSGDNCSEDSTAAASAATSEAASLDSSAEMSPAISVGSTSHVAYNLCADHSYTYTVAAVGANGLISAPSAPVTVTPLPKPGCNAKYKAPNLPIGAFNATGGWGWVLDYRFSSESGMELRNIMLNGRMMAEWISAPYFVIAAHNSSGSRQTYGQFWANGSNPDRSLRSTLVGFNTPPPSDTHLFLEATYKIDRIPGAPRACLTVTQEYEFYRPGKGVWAGLGPPGSDAGPCEPSGTVPCAKFRPMVRYQFHGADGEFLDWINIPQRHHYQVRGATDNSVGVFLDPDTIGEGAANLGYPAKRNPVTNEFWSPVIGATSATSVSAPHRDVRFDNLHQTHNTSVQEPRPPFRPAGCPECLHNHWRWGAFFGPEWGGGAPLILPRSKQTVDIAVVRYPGKVDAQRKQWISLVQGNSLRQPITEMCAVCIKPIITGVKGIDPVFWFSPTGYTDSDTLFYHTAWFNPHPPNASSAAVSIEAATSSPAPNAPRDGPVSVNFGDVYQNGTTTFRTADISTLPPLPPGYAALGNTGYSIETTSIASGPNTITFSVASVTDQNTFNNQRIFQLEPDPFDPDRELWVEKTILSPDSPASDFSMKTLSVRTMDLGVFVIGSLVQSIPPSTDVADIAVACTASANPITAGNQLSYTIQITNNGPQMAHEVALRNGLSPDANFASATSAHGTCKEIDGTVFCKLNSLGVGETATVIIIVTPTEGTGSFPPAGKSIYNGVLAKANEGDSNLDNNSTTQTTLVMPNPNKAPNVSITSPLPGTPYVGPTSFTVSATAIDSDGTIAKVEVFDNGELIGEATPTGNNQYVTTKQNAAFGPHSLIAIATDNGGRQNISNGVGVIVNGSANVNITSPLPNALFSPGSNITVTASATHPTGIINTVEFLANGYSIGTGVFVGGSQYSLEWNNIAVGSYTLVAVATDSLGVKTNSAPTIITVDTPPTVTINSPTDGAVFPSLTNISVSATAQSPYASIAKVEFYANQTLIGTASDVGTDQFAMTWRNLADGFYSIKAVATDNLGISATSPAITIGVNTGSTRPGELIWFDDALPTGATEHGEDAANKWYWVDANPAAFSGSKAHQSRIVSQLVDPPSSIHTYSFDGATMTLPVNAGDRLFTYVFLDINNMPRQITLEWKDANGWGHRAYWKGRSDTFEYKILVDGDAILVRRKNPDNSFMGALPPAGRWVRLEVPASKVALEGSTLSGMAFTLDGGRATFDLAGKVTANAPPPPTTPPGDSVWIDDSLPPGAVMGGVNEQWNWNAIAVYSGQAAHQSYGGERYVSHHFTGAQTPMQINPGDVLFTYVYLGDPDTSRSANVPDEIMLQWYDGTSWDHRAFWGENFIGQQQNVGVQGTESQRFMGGLLRDGRSGGCAIPGHPGWCRLEVPASYVGLEGKTVSGMAFGAYRNTGHPVVFWDRSGKAPQLTTVPLQLSSTYGVWELFSSNYGYSYNFNDQGEPEHVPVQRDAFFAHASQAAGTVPMHRFRRPGNYEYFYTKCRTCPGTDWQYDGIAFYVYPDASTPNTVPLYLYKGNQAKYVLTIDQNEAAGKPESQLWGYVYGTNPQIPFAPTQAVLYGCSLSWRDNSATESGFKIEEQNSNDGTWSQIGTAAANIRYFCVGGDACNYDLCTSTGSYRVRAFNNFGDSAYSNVASGQGETSSAQPAGPAEPSSPETPPPNSAPNVEITSPANGGVVDRNFAIYTNAADIEGNGTLTLVEIFANGNKIGEMTDAPFPFVWNNAPVGTYSLTAKATDNMGATTTSAPINVTVGSPVTFAINGFSGPYDGQPHRATGTATGVNGEDLSNLINFGTAFTNAPGGIAHWTFAGNSSYLPASGDVAITITPRAANLNVSGFTGAYDGQPHGASGSATGVNSENLGSLLDLGSSFTSPPGGTTHWTFAGNENYNAASGDVSIVINKATPVVTWNNPNDIAAGTALTATQLNATASVPGTFTYSPSAGTVLSLGNNQQLSVTFTPSDANSYNSVTATTRINVVGSVLFADDFNDNSLDSSKWTVSDPNSPAVVSEQGQELRITVPPNTAGYNSAFTTSTYDLRGRTVQVDMVQHLSQGGWVEDYFEAVLDGQNFFYMSTGAGSMVFAAVTGGVTDRVVINYDPNARYLRMRHDQSVNTINLETSADRINWTLRKSVTAGFSLAALRFHLVAGAWGTGNGAPGMARFDNIQLIPNETANVLGFSNRGFELPVLGSGGYQYAPANAGWTFVSGGGVTANSSGFTYSNPAAPEGNQVAFLQGGAGSSISQTVTGFRADVAYTITFAAAQRANCCGAGGQDFQVYLDDLLLATVRPTGANYVDYSTPEFNTTAGAHILKFVGLNSLGGDNSAFIDNVRITNTAPPTAANAAAYVSQSVPATMVAGRKYSVSVKMRNTGSNTWTTPANYNLGSQAPQDNMTWGVGRVALPSPVLPGAQATFNFVVTAPATAGTYNFQWRMVQDFVEWFGQTGALATVSVVAPGNNTAYSALQPFTVPGVLESELFDNGGEGNAYHDTTPGTYGQDYDQPNYPTTAFRLPTDVDIYKSAPGYSNSYLVLMQAGDWMNYTVNVAQTGTYMITAKTYDGSAYGGAFHFECDGADITGSLQVPGDAANWREVKKSGVWLTAGTHVLKLVADTNGSEAWYTGDFDYIRFELVAPQPVRWTSTGGVTVSGNALTKTAAQGWGNAGAISSQSIGSGDGYVEVTISEANTHRMIGLSNGDTSKNWDDIDFAIYPLSNGTLQIYEGANYRGDFGRYATGDVLRVGVENGAVIYRKNGQTIFRSNTAPSYPLLVDTSLYSVNSTLTNAMISCSASAPGPIEAELFDNGGEGAGYHDTTPGTHGQDYDQPPNYPTPAYRLPIDVDVYKHTSYSNNYLTLMQAGDWMNYTINVPSAGNYALQARVIWGGTNGTPGTFHVEVDGVNKTGTLQLPDTNWGWSVITPAQLQLTAGQHFIRLVAETNAGNGFVGDFDYLSFVPLPSPAYGGSPIVIPGTLEVENYDNGAAEVAYHDTSPGTHGQDYDQPPSYPPPTFRQPTDVDIYKASGYSNNYLIVMQAGDWMKYSVSVAQAGSYTMLARVAWGGSGGVLGTFHVEVDGANVTGPLQMPDTNWSLNIISKSGIQLPAGEHILRLVADTNAGNGYMGDIDYLRFVPETSGPVGYWKFDENSGATATDSSGQGNTGTLVSGATWALGYPGTAVMLDGSAGYVQVGARSSLTLSNSATFAAWINPTAANNGIIINKEGEYEIARFPDGTIQWAIANTSPGWAWINTGAVAPLNQWTHVAITYDNGLIKTYQNGALVHTYNGAGAIGDVDGNLNDFRIGGRQLGPQFFPGRLDEVKVYNRALTASEVISLTAP